MRESDFFFQYTAAVVIDMGVFGPYGLSQRNTTYTGTAVTNALALGEHTTISRLVSDKANYEFVVHPGDLAYADAWVRLSVRPIPNQLLTSRAHFRSPCSSRRTSSTTSTEQWLRVRSSTRLSTRSSGV